MCFGHFVSLSYIYMWVPADAQMEDIGAFYPDKIAGCFSYPVSNNVCFTKEAGWPLQAGKNGRTSTTHITPGLTVFTDRPIRSLSLHGRMQMMHDKARCVTTLDMDAFETRSIKEAGIHWLQHQPCGGITVKSSTSERGHPQTAKRSTLNE